MADSTSRDQLKLDVDEQEKSQGGPVECLGMTFPNDEARRAYFLDILREKLKDPEFRKIEGFPIGSDEDILALSDPPYFTPCPNPFTKELVHHHGRAHDPADAYRCGPFHSDVSEGKNSPIYNAHSYHTKVPHKAIMRYILHYTKPGDIVLDGFCGTGMTGVAAQLCGDRESVESLGFAVDDEGIIHNELGEPFSKVGPRRAILNDLSPSAAFIAHTYNTPIDIDKLQKDVSAALASVRAECEWMYVTAHSDGRKGQINYVVWSDVFLCPHCGREIVYWQAAVDKEQGRVFEDFPCPGCGAKLSKRELERVFSTTFDSLLGHTVKQAKQIPVVIDYSVEKERFEKIPDAEDLALIGQINEKQIPYEVPTDLLPEGYNTRQPKASHGFSNVHHFFTKRNLWVVSMFLGQIRDRRYLSLFTGIASDVSRMARVKVGYYFKGGGGPFIPGLSGTLYVPSLSVEKSVIFALENRLATFLRTLCYPHFPNTTFISVGSASNMSAIESNSVDYVFTDPPFGGNIMYSELNYIWESWLKIFTDNSLEAIENETQGKGLDQYRDIMAKCFREFYRVLKPSRWITVEFHNSRNCVWNAIQGALQLAGFIIADVRTLDKQQGSFKQVTSSATVKQDLIISAYKPKQTPNEISGLCAGSEDAVWRFIEEHLGNLPVINLNGSIGEAVSERQSHMLFDRMVGFHVRRGIAVPMSAGEFYSGLTQRFPERDGMYFLPEQAADYDRKRARIKDIESPGLFVSDESSAIRWIREQLRVKPQTFQELQPVFMQQTRTWSESEAPIDLHEILKENFLCYLGDEDVPPQIHSYLSSNFKDSRSLRKDAPALRAKAKDRWYVPDPSKQIDLEKMRMKALMREFEEYKQSTARKLKVFRSEAVRAGFRVAFEAHDYQTIVNVAKKLPQDVLDEDSTLRMFYDMACARLEE